MQRRHALALMLGLLSLVMALIVFFWQQPASPVPFNPERAYQDVTNQVALGPRVPGSPAHEQIIEYIRAQLEQAGWQVTLQKATYQGQDAINIVATRKISEPQILLGAHYDSRLYADNDPDPARRKNGVPAANDGASGVAVLLEMARVLPENGPSVGLVFFDIEDNGNIPGWDWILGSRAFAESLTYRPQVFVLLDMIGDADLNIYMERNSDEEYTRQIWEQAKKLGYEKAFIPEYKYRVIDDHVPFLEKGIRAVDLIDLDYPYWHTTQDTPDKVSPQSLKIVGDTLLAWIATFKP